MPEVVTRYGVGMDDPLRQLGDLLAHIMDQGLERGYEVACPVASGLSYGPPLEPTWTRSHAGPTRGGGRVVSEPLAEGEERMPDTVSRGVGRAEQDQEMSETRIVRSKGAASVGPVAVR